MERSAPCKGDPPFDRWTAAHVAAGAALGLLLPLRWVLASLVAFEVVEAVMRRVGRGGQGGGLFEHESRANIAVDVAVAFLAAAVVQAVRGGMHW